jgi:hypothetical protein
MHPSDVYDSQNGNTRLGCQSKEEPRRRIIMVVADDYVQYYLFITGGGGAGNPAWNNQTVSLE